ncbi:unnamed protein product [Paramecium sonneborni]|uniref:Protein kinase domain-containing protein n=1 Tax=Paramecium sonneborni TaxID=65129 RepID=A0A8S1Q4Z8_9CILI|nr:unnamed protein product [Paramecium sonneborni]
MSNDYEIRNLYTYEKTRQNQIGMGAFGEVYECKRKDGQQNDPLCVKIIHKNRNNIKLWKQEIEIVKKIMEIKSDNLVRIENIINSPHQFEIIMERCDMDLEQEFKLLKQNQSWYNDTQCVNVVKQIVEGCRILYKNNIVHRDIKPSNILIKILNQGQENERRLYKISDFGFSKILQNLLDPNILTRVGTPIYSSPQIFSTQAFSGKCDIYSYGILFYQIFFSGDLPYNLKTKDSIKDFHKLIQNRQFKCQQPFHPQKELIADLLDKMIVYEENERISFEQLFQHPLINLLEKPSCMADSLFNPLQNISKEQIKILVEEKKQEQILDRLKRVFKIQTQLFRKYLFYELISNKLQMTQDTKKKIAAFCLRQLGMQEILYCMGFMHIIVSDLHPFFKDDKDLDNIKNILQQCSENINKYPLYQDLSQKIKQQYFNFKKSIFYFNIDMSQELKQNQQNLSKIITQEFISLIEKSRSERIDRKILIENLKSLLNQKFLNGFEAEIEKAITLDEKFPIQNYKEINPNDIFNQ